MSYVIRAFVSRWAFRDRLFSSNYTGKSSNLPLLSGALASFHFSRFIALQNLTLRALIQILIGWLPLAAKCRYVTIMILIKVYLSFCSILDLYDFIIYSLTNQSLPLEIIKACFEGYMHAFHSTSCIFTTDASEDTLKIGIEAINPRQGGPQTWNFWKPEKVREFCGTWKMSGNFLKLGKVREFYLHKMNIVEVFSKFIQVVNKN